MKVCEKRTEQEYKGGGNERGKQTRKQSHCMKEEDLTYILLYMNIIIYITLYY